MINSCYDTGLKAMITCHKSFGFIVFMNGDHTTLEYSTTGLTMIYKKLLSH